MPKKPGIKPKKAATKRIGLDGEPLKPLKAEAEVRADESGFTAGLPCKLDRVMKTGRTLREDLSDSVGKWLSQELDNQQALIDKLQVWDRQYKGIKEPKNSPYQGCSNTAIPKTRINVDALVVRICDAVWGQIKVWIVKATKPEFVDLAMELEDYLDWWQKNIVRLRKKLFSPILQCIKTGTGIVKIDYTKKKRVCYLNAAADATGKGIYDNRNGGKVKKSVRSEYDGADLAGISREDFVISSEATDIQNAFLVGFRTYLRKPELELKAQTKVYDDTILGNIVSHDYVDDVKVERAAGQGKLIKSDEKGLYEIWELWLRYDVDEDGEEDDIVVTYHRASKTVLRAIYNPMFMGFRPFVSLVFYPSEYSFDGMGVCQVLEKTQVELDMLHNMRIDRLEQISARMYLASRASGFDENDNPFVIAPGYVRYVDGDLEKAVREIQFSDNYPSTYTEENLLTNYMGEAVGVTPAVLGQSVSERPVARDTMALLQENNKKFKFGIDNIRYGLGEVGWMSLEVTAQYQPRLSYYDTGTEGVLEEKTIEFPLDYLRDGVSVELMASSELMNTEIRREIDKEIYVMISDFVTKTGGMVMAAANPMLPPQVREYFIAVSEIGTKLMKRICQDYGIKDFETLVPDATQMIAQVPPPPPPPPPMGAGGPPPPGGQPPGPGGGEEGPPISPQELEQFVAGSREF